MLLEPSVTSIGDFQVFTSNNGGHPPEFWAKQAAQRIISVADTTHPAIRDQANDFKNAVEQVILHYMKRAIECDRSTVSHLVSEAGHSKLAEHLRRA